MEGKIIKMFLKGLQYGVMLKVLEGRNLDFLLVV